MNPLGKASSEFQLLRKELEAQGEILSAERLERKAQLDMLRLEIEAIKRTLARLDPKSVGYYHEIYQELLQSFDPDAQAAS